MKEPVLVAETDEHGSVACVWGADASGPTHRIFDPRLHGNPLVSAIVSEALKHQISAWLASMEMRDERPKPKFQ